MIKKLLFTLLVCLLPLNAFATSTATVCASDDCKLWLHMNGTDASTTFTDSSASSHSMTAHADAQIDTAQSKFGGASGLFDVTGDYVSTSDSADFDLGSGDFTIDTWVRFNSTSGTAQEIVGQYELANQRAWTLDWNTSNELRFLYTTDGTASTQSVITFSWTPSAATWYHVALTRNGSNLRAFIGGTQIGTTQTLSATIFNSSADLTIGCLLNSGSPLLLFNGWIDELRIVKGTSVWTGNFTPPSAEYTSGSRRRIILT